VVVFVCCLCRVLLLVGGFELVGATIVKGG